MTVLGSNIENEFGFSKIPESFAANQFGLMDFCYYAALENVFSIIASRILD